MKMQSRPIWCKNISYVLLGFLLCSHITGQEAMVVEKTIAKVGGEFVLYSELQELVKYEKEEKKGFKNIDQCKLFERLLNTKMMVNQARLDSVLVDDKEVESQLDRRFDHILKQMGGDEKEFENYYGKSIYEMKESVRPQQREQLIVQKMQQSILGKVNITPEEVKIFFNSIPKDSIPFLNSEYEIDEIVYKPKINEEEKAKAYNKLKEVRRRIIEDNASLEELASINSEDPGSAANGGDLGWASRGSYVAEFEAAAYNLEINEISEIIETEFGYHILKLIDRRGNNIHLKHILIIPRLVQSDMDSAKNILISVKDKLNSDSISFEYALTKYGYDKVPSYNNGGRMQNPKTEDTFYEADELPYEIYFALENHKIGDYSEPLEFIDNGGKKFFRIIKIRTKTEPHIANLKQDFSRLSTIAKESKKNSYFNEWMAEKLLTTQVNIHSDFKICSNLSSYFGEN